MNEEIDKLSKQISFLVEIDKLKNVYRKIKLINNPRFETSAEHSWHSAIVALILKGYSKVRIDIKNVLKMLLIHDIAEIYARDHYAFDKKNIAEYKLNEEKAAHKVFGLLPEEQKKEFRSLWIEFNENISNDAKFANAIDCIQPFFIEYYSNTNKHPPQEEMLERMKITKYVFPELWEYIYTIIINS